MKSPCRNLALGLVIALTSVHAAFADDVVLFRQGQKPDPRDIARMLKGGPGPEGGTRARGIRMNSEEAPAPQGQVASAPDRPVPPAAAPAAQAPAVNSPVTFALQIQFPFNSAQIQPEMMESLDAVAEGIKLAGHLKIVVEGHTDAAGAAEYNLVLSKKRAESVRDYLAAHGVPVANLKAVGRGKLEPLVKDNPNAPENRRVQFRTQG